jgi:hypothetical protein
VRRRDEAETFSWGEYEPGSDQDWLSVKDWKSLAHPIPAARLEICFEIAANPLPCRRLIRAPTCLDPPAVGIDR